MPAALLLCQSRESTHSWRVLVIGFAHDGSRISALQHYSKLQETAVIAKSKKNDKKDTDDFAEVEIEQLFSVCNYVA